MAHDGSSSRHPRLLEVVRAKIRAKHYSPRTEEAYVGWIRRFVRFHRGRHPREMGEAEVTAFLSSLAVEGHVAASTQNQALSALIFLYGEVLGAQLDWLAGLVRARRPARLPVVLTVDTHAICASSGCRTPPRADGSLRAALEAAGVAVGPLTYPAERPRGRFRLTDPDGYDLAVTHT